MRVVWMVNGTYVEKGRQMFEIFVDLEKTFARVN